MTYPHILSQDDDSDKVDEETSLLLRKSSSSLSFPSTLALFEKARTEIIEQSKTFFPALQRMLLSNIPLFITLRILGELSDNAVSSSVVGSESTNGVEFAGAALATTLCNVTGMSLCVGFSFALSTLAGQAKGELLSRKRREEGIDSCSPSFTVDGNLAVNSIPPNTTVVFLLRGMVVQVLLVIPVGIWWLFGIEDFLLQLGQTPALATTASSYLKILTPSLWCYSIQWTMTVWAQSIGMADIPAHAALLGLILHIPFNYIFVAVFQQGYLGCAYATCCFQIVQLLYIGLYLFVHKKGRSRVVKATGGTAIGQKTLSIKRELTIACSTRKGFVDYLKLAIPGFVSMSEWWASEVAIFLSGRLQYQPQIMLSAMAIYQSINSFCFMIPCAFAAAGTARVGNLLGEGRPMDAEMSGKISVACCGICSGSIGILLYILPHDFFPSLFVSNAQNQNIIDEAAKTIKLLSISVFADGVQTGFNGIIKGCGRQRIVVPIVIVAYWVIGVPLAYYFGLVCQLSDVGLVAGMTVGTWCHMLLLAAVVIGTTNWSKEAQKAKQRVSQ